MNKQHRSAVNKAKETAMSKQCSDVCSFLAAAATYPPVWNIRTVIHRVPRTSSSVGFVSPPVACPQLNHIHQHRTQLATHKSTNIQLVQYW